MQTRLKFTCEHCDAHLSAKPSAIGRSVDCPRCAAPVPVPQTTALVPIKPRMVVPEVVDDDEPPRKLARRDLRRQSSTTPVELCLPGQLGGMKAEVDRETSNMMATTFLGAVLVALGAVLFSMFGGKSKSA